MDTGIPIDVTDLADIRAKLPQLEAAIQQRRRELDRLDAVADRLAALAGVRRRDNTKAKRNGKPAARPPSSVEIVVGVVNKGGGAMTINEVTERIDPPIKRDTVSWALWQAERTGQLKRIGKGVYAPLNYKVTPLLAQLGSEGDQ